MVSNKKELDGEYVCVSNVHTTVMAFEDENYRVVQNSSILSIPDGGPLSFVGRKRGFTNMDRIAGPSFMGEVFNLSTEHGWRHFFYGSTEDTLSKLKTALEKKYPGISIVGMYSPPFRALSKKEDQEIITIINDANPDFVWVGLGAPKQENWMYNHKGIIKGLMIGVGAGFDYYAGKLKRAPMWMQKMNLEWAYRLFQEPKRLFKRYWVTNNKFIWNAVIKGQ